MLNLKLFHLDFRVAKLFLLTQLALALGYNGRRRQHHYGAVTNITHGEPFHNDSHGGGFNVKMFLILYSSVMLGICLCACVTARCIRHLEESEERVNRERAASRRNEESANDDAVEVRVSAERRIKRFNEHEVIELPSSADLLLKKPLDKKEIAKWQKVIFNKTDNNTLRFYSILLDHFDRPKCIVMKQDLSEGLVLCKKNASMLPHVARIEFFLDLDTLNRAIVSTRGRLLTSNEMILSSDTKVYQFKIQKNEMTVGTSHLALDEAPPLAIIETDDELALKGRQKSINIKNQKVTSVEIPICALLKEEEKKCEKIIEAAKRSYLKRTLFSISSIFSKVSLGKSTETTSEYNKLYEP